MASGAASPTSPSSISGTVECFGGNEQLEDEAVRQALRGGTSGSPGQTLVVGADQLRRVLRRAHRAVDTSHRAATATWRSPLSLFGTSAEASAKKRGVPAWAISTAKKARNLVDDAASLHDLTDVYEAQILTAKRESRGVNRAALLNLIERLDQLASELAAHQPFLEAARGALDDPSKYSEVEPSGYGGSQDNSVSSAPLLPVLSPEARATAGNGSGNDGEAEGPVVILEPRRAVRAAAAANFFKASGAFIFKALESAIDVVGAAGTATGVAEGLSEEANSSSPSQGVSESKRRSSSLKVDRPAWDEVGGEPSTWLDLEIRIANLDEEDGVKKMKSEKSLWERCRRKSDRRWTLA
eukprot:TRINITY_DN78539_c20_g1_i1.p1 TRINITY_DN78539_c20_g1~~TRINITY_DN78539_c20_g1_i1.p1  ORF type:complete len:377 (+),score=87.69 TRINITY_DN78539_c20_g1_i1:67-1131(+)